MVEAFRPATPIDRVLSGLGDLRRERQLLERKRPAQVVDPRWLRDAGIVLFMCRDEDDVGDALIPP